MTYPILYSFRRCPYAIRARLALRVSGIQVELREVVLADKPAALRLISPKATVPVLVVSQQQVIAESIEIMYWALQQHDPQDWLKGDSEKLAEGARLIAYNDSEFKPQLDRYKYADRFPQQPMEVYRTEGEIFLQQLDAKLAVTSCLLCEFPTLADMAIVPFIRQFSSVDSEWFENSPYPFLRAWLRKLLVTPLFTSVMTKYQKWEEGDEPVIVF